MKATVTHLNILDELNRVIQLEIDTLAKVRGALDESYTKATELLFNCSGRVIVTGVGKSGIIAQKIVATLVSTGTLASFLHSGDALHGDLGMVSQGDVFLALSKSGETEELLNTLPYAKKVGAAVISITAAPDSSLGKNSDVVLYTPVDEEACPLNLAPTSSTTAALAVGDALAMCLMKMRGFQPEDFAMLHPGGQLGKRLLLTVEDIMRAGHRNPVVSLQESVRVMLSEITRKLSGAVSVVDDAGDLVGLVTDFDIRRSLEQGSDIFNLGIADIMNPSPTSIRSDENAGKALDMMRGLDRAFSVLPVVDQGSRRVVGMVHVHDLVAAGL